MPAPRLNFADDEEERKRKEEEERRKRLGILSPPPQGKHSFFSSLEEAEAKRSAPSPPAPIRDPKKHSMFSNLWAGLESIPGGIKDQEEAARHAIASDIKEGHGAFGFVTTPAHVAIAASKFAVTGSKKDKAAIREAATNPWEKTRSAFDKEAEKIVKESYETTRRATGTRGSKKFTEIWHDNPVAAIGGVAILAPPVFRVAGITKMAKKIQATNRVPTRSHGAGQTKAERDSDIKTLVEEFGYTQEAAEQAVTGLPGTRRMTKTEAVKAATVETYYPGTLDKLGIEGSPFSPRFSGRRTSRSPTGRAAQRAFDWASEKIDEGLGPDAPLSKTRREAAGRRRADDLQRSRLVTNAMRHVSTFADYLNAGITGRVSTTARIGTALGQRKETLAARDAAVGAALHASTAIDPVEAVRHASEDTKAILESGRRDAHNGDISDVEEGKREGQTVYVTHGRDEDGNPIREKSTVISDEDGQVTVSTPDGGERTIPHNRAHLLSPEGEGDIPLHEDEVKMLTRRAALLDTAHEELTSEPRLEAKFRAAVQSMSDLGQMNEQLGEDFFSRGMDPTGSELMALRERLTARRNQFVPRLGGEGVEPIDYYEGLWGDLQKTMEKAGISDEQQYYFLTAMDHLARVWANEVEGRNPADYLASPEGKNLGGIDFAKPEDLEAQVNAMFQTAGERNHLLKTTTTVLITGPPKIGDLVSTSKGFGVIEGFFDGADGQMARVAMNEGAAVYYEVPLDDVRVSPHPWRGSPVRDDYVMTPDGPGLLISSAEHGPDYLSTYRVQLFEQENGMFVPGETHGYRAGEVQRIDDPHMGDQPIFHLKTQEVLADPKFPKKGTVEQYRKAFKEVKPDEQYWMGLSAIPMLEAEVKSTRAIVETIEKKMAENPEVRFKYRRHGEYEASWVTGEELLSVRIPQRDAAPLRLARYLEDPDPAMLLDADYGGKSFSSQAIQDSVEARSHFLDVKEYLFSSHARDSSKRDRWGPRRSGEDAPLIIRNPTEEQPYHELVISLPARRDESGYEADLFTSGHWSSSTLGGGSPVVHIRFHEIIDNEGNRAILIDEMQSDWNNEGRRVEWKDYVNPGDIARAQKLRDHERRYFDLQQRAERELGMGGYEVENWFDRKLRETAYEMNQAIRARNAEKRAERIAEGGDGYPTPEDPDEPELYEYGRDRETLMEELETSFGDDPTFKDMLKAKRRFDRWNKKRQELREAADALERGGSNYDAVNRGPMVMSDAAKHLGMKRMIRWAADHGQTRIIWTRGHEQGVRYTKFPDIPYGQGRGNMDPWSSHYGNEFLYPTGATYTDFGRNYRSDEVSEWKLRRMQQAQPIEVKDIDMVYNRGEDFVLLPNGHPNDVEEGIPGQQSLTGEEIPLNPARHARWAKIIDDTEDGVIVQPIDPLWDPARVEIDWRGSRGGAENPNMGAWEVKIVNRIGHTLYSDTLDVVARSKNDLIAEVFKDWTRPNRNFEPSGHAVEITPENVRNLTTLRDLLEESESLEADFDYMLEYPSRELDQAAWDQHLADNPDLNNDDFKAIRDYDAPEKRKYTNLEAAIATLERQRKEESESQLMLTRDYDSEIRQLKKDLDTQRRYLENAGHDSGYDVMLPQMAERMLKPYREDADYSRVAIKNEIYRGRYGVESRSTVVSPEGDIHGWLMILPERMLKDAKERTTPLFQRGNDIIKGASTWVGGPDGQRFIALTEHADFSTLMHEFIGHATEEMKRRYPELWEAVERDMGRPLEKWTRPQHEKFAKWVERYWMEGKAPSPELVTIMRMVKEWMKGVYSSITMLGKPMPDSTRILLNRHLGQGVTARPGARTYVPHVSQFDTMMDNAPGGTRLSAGDNVIGRNMPDRRNFGAKRNRGILWQSGELALSARPIIDQYFRRTKFLETEAVRQEMYDEGHPMPKNGRPPKGAWLVRNPQTAPQRMSARNKSKLSEEDFSRLIGEGDSPEEFVAKMEEIRRDHYAEPGEHPEWTNDLENVRWVEGGKISQRIQNVFPTAPRGRVAASAGSLNAMARLTGIYLRPLHYLVGNIPQNVLMVALTNPAALVNSVKYGAYSFLPRVVREVGMQPRDLFAHDRHLYNRIKTETGDIQAGAGLPDFYTMANNRFQKGERRLNKISQGSAEKLGELADQPYRVSVWIAHAKGYGYNTPDEWRELLDSERGSAEARIRDDIAQATREDMIDFNTLSPGERQNVSRFFYLWAFTRGFAKWPLTFAREYPGRLGFAMMQADTEQTDDNGLPLSWLPSSGVLKSNQGPGKVRDLGFLDPTGGLRQQIETGIQLAHGNFSGIGGMTTPPLETGLQAITGGPRAPKGGLRGLADQLARDTVPFWDIGKKAATPGLSPTARVSRALDFTDRFGVKPEIGRGKNAEKKRLEDEKIQRTLKQADRLDALPLVTLQQSAYWHHKYLEQQIRFGAQARRKGTALTNAEKLTILYATAADYFPQANLPRLSEALKESGAYQEALRSALSDSMFGARNQVVNG